MSKVWEMGVSEEGADKEGVKKITPPRDEEEEPLPSEGLLSVVDICHT